MSFHNESKATLGRIDRSVFHVVAFMHECISTTQATRHWAASLAKNRTLRVVSLESNQLDSQSVKDIAQAIAGNKDSEITQLRLAPQKNMGRFFGRHVEEAIGSMMERNDRIL